MRGSTEPRRRRLGPNGIFIPRASVERQIAPWIAEGGRNGEGAIRVGRGEGRVGRIPKESPHSDNLDIETEEETRLVSLDQILRPDHPLDDSSGRRCREDVVICLPLAFPSRRVERPARKVTIKSLEAPVRVNANVKTRFAGRDSIPNYRPVERSGCCWIEKPTVCCRKPCWITSPHLPQLPAKRPWKPRARRLMRAI